MEDEIKRRRMRHGLFVETGNKDDSADEEENEEEDLIMYLWPWRCRNCRLIRTIIPAVESQIQNDIICPFLTDLLE